MDTKYSALLRRAFDEYLVRWDAGEMEPEERYLPYDFEKVDHHEWPLLGAELVKDELRELTNLLNHWLGSLREPVINFVCEAYHVTKAHVCQSVPREAKAKRRCQPFPEKSLISLLVAP